MKVKIDTKEKFHVISILEPDLSANMTEELVEKLLLYTKFPIKNIVLDMGAVSNIELPAAVCLADLQEVFYDKNCSFVICELQPPVEQFLDDNALLELLNVTPTISEGGDIVQMEEVERELI